MKTDPNLTQDQIDRRQARKGDLLLLFKYEMVKAILEGRKTQTRRVIKLPSWSTGDWGDFEFDELGIPFAICAQTGCLAKIPSPYGKTGDILWVRETWRTHQDFNHLKPSDLPPNSPIQYKADLELRNGSVGVMAKWRPSIFMPRWASRIALKVRSVRVERLQDISEADAIAEGIAHNWLGDDCPPEYKNEWRNYLADENGFPCFSARDSFASLWDSINQKRGCGWDTNSPVWVVKFERIENE